MLPPPARITRSDDFARVVRRGVRTGRRTLVVHLLRTGDETVPRAGLVVSKAVGGAVVRNRVARRIRHLLRDLLPTLPDGVLVVVRALPAAAPAGPELRDDLAGALAGALERGAAREPSGARA